MEPLTFVDISWMKPLMRKIKAIREKRAKEVYALDNDFGDTRLLLDYYVIPNCQHHNPADYNEEERSRSVVKAPVYDILQDFLGSETVLRDGRNQLFVLADAGMGKTSLLLMLKLWHLFAFWPKGYDCLLLKLGEKTLDTLNAHADKAHTVLLLDALDEDPMARGRVSERLKELLDASKHFRHVIITCRTQFFPPTSLDPFGEAGRVRFDAYRCPMLFLSLFDDKQVETYLLKRFPDTLRDRLRFRDNPLRQKAQSILQPMKSLRFRPLLLAYIEDLLKAKERLTDPYQVFRALLEVWLFREIGKMQKQKLQPIPSVEQLWAACQVMAVYLQIMGQRTLSSAELDKLTANFRAFAHLDHLDIGGRSLLNRNSERDYRFAHYSIQEFLVAHALREGKLEAIYSEIPREISFHKPHATSQMLEFLVDIKLDSATVTTLLEWLDWSDIAWNDINPDLLVRCGLLVKSLSDQGLATIDAYHKSLILGKASFPLNQIRVIFIGYGQSGKTSLIRALHGESVETGHEDMTWGIDIRDWLVPGTDIIAHFWDFGGQVMAHATHQFFLREHCVYILVMEPRAEINANQQAQYWLEHVRLFGKDAPVLLVGNKADQLALHLDLNTLKYNYPNIVGFYSLSCIGYRNNYQHEFKIFHSALVRELRSASTHQLMLTPRHYGVLEDLRNRPRGQAFLERQEFENLCEQHQVEVAEELNRDWLLDLLDNLGVVVHFPDNDWLGAYVLNPRWLTYGVYTLLYSDEARKAYGRLTQKEVIAILGRSSCRDNLGNVLEFPPVKCRFILDAMRQFELCYALPSAVDTFIFPDLLPSDRPENLGLDMKQALAFDFDFEALLPRHLMTSFIVRRHEEILEKRLWQNGVRLQSRNWQAGALVQADHHRRRLSLWVAGPEASRYFTALHDEFMGMIRRMDMRHSQFQEWVVLPGTVFEPGEEWHRADFRDLLAQEAAGKTEYICKYGSFNLAEVLKIMPKDEREKQAASFVGASFTNSVVNLGKIDQAQSGTGNQFTVNLPPEAKQMDKTLADLHYEVGVQVADIELRGKALRELEMIRQALQTIGKGGVEEKRTALDILSRFGDKLKKGVGGTVEALKSLKDGGEAVVWLIEKAPAIIDILANCT